ncbi:MAG: NUDIX domain-containing protein [Phycisphaeraceae bacterium]|nr:NUDIX domain-containing protein [Phycisphaeraceae bacterium]
MAGPAIRTDIVEVYVFRQLNHGGTAEFLQLHRASGVMTGSWQPVMGHVEEGETAVRAAARELAEETGWQIGRDTLGFWQLESLNGFFLAEQDEVMLCPGFAVHVPPTATPTPDGAHDGFRWVRRDMTDRAFLWPGQRQAIEQIVRDILPGDSPLRETLRLKGP